MLNFQVNYTHPWLLLLIPLAVICTLVPYFRLNKRYRCTRNRIISIVMHLVAIILGINLLAGISFSYEVPNEGNEVILLVDVTDSSVTTQEQKDEFIQTVLGLCEEDCKVGVVKFGFDQVYAAEFSHDTMEVMEQYLVSENPDVTATNLADALKYAAGLFTNPASAKIVVLSDGVETDNAALSVIKSIAAQGIKVDTLCFPNPETDEVQLLSVNIPEQHIVPGSRINVELTLRHNQGKGERTFMLNLYSNGEKMNENPVTVSVTKEEQVVPIQLALEEKGLYELRFELLAGSDTEVKNNAYLTYVHLQTFDKVLLIERNEGESQRLQTLLEEKYDVNAVSIQEDVAQIPTDLKAMAEYEQVILVNIAYSDMPAGFEELLNQYVYVLGGGLFTVGGQNEMINGQLVPHAYNRNDMAQSTYYKDMLPVNVVDYVPPIAVMIVVDTSASMSGERLPKALEGAEACLEALNERDYCGVVSFSVNASEKLEVLPVSRIEDIRKAIRAIDYEESATGGTIFANAIMTAGRALSVIQNVERKHIILVTDGNPGDEFEKYSIHIEDNVADGITMSVVCVDIAPGNVEKMEKTAEAAGGKFYNVPYGELSSLPIIMQQDMALEAISEIQYGEEFIPQIKDRTPVVNGINQEDMPPLTGYYGTTLKQDAQAPLVGAYVPVYAQWKYGNGNVGSFMCDLNGNWSSQFLDSPTGQTIVNNIVENLFPSEKLRADDLEFAFKTDNYTTQLNVYGVADGNTVQVQVTPVFDTLQAMLPEGVRVVAAEDNRRFTFVIKEAGLYEVKLMELDEAGNVVTEVVTHQTFSYSQEYNAFTDRKPIGQELLALLAADGKGVVLTDPVEVYQSFEKTIKLSYDPRILFLILVIVCVLLDIAVRKFKFKWPHELIREHRLKAAEQAERSGR